MLGQKVYISGVGVRRCDDTGGRITTNRIDVYFTNHQEALKFGVRTAKVYHYAVRAKRTYKRR
jgi:3D (Asp-Asp-Asp) domain-containing protein